MLCYDHEPGMWQTVALFTKSSIKQHIFLCINSEYCFFWPLFQTNVNIPDALQIRWEWHDKRPAGKRDPWWIEKSVSSHFVFPGIPNWHHLCPDVDRQPSQIQQHHEEVDSQQQHGRTHLAAGHHLQELQDCRLPLDHHAQPAAQDMERREDTLHLKVKPQTATFSLCSCHWAPVACVRMI